MEHPGTISVLGRHPMTGRGAEDAEQADLTIDCDRCRVRETGVCGDCVVTFLLGRESDDAVIIDADEYRGLRLLEEAGLVPGIRFEDQAG